MKRARRYGLHWTKLDAEDHRWIAPRFVLFFFLAVALLWGLPRLLPLWR